MTLSDRVFIWLCDDRRRLTVGEIVSVAFAAFVVFMIALGVFLAASIAVAFAPGGPAWEILHNVSR